MEGEGQRSRVPACAGRGVVGWGARAAAADRHVLPFVARSPEAATVLLGARRADPLPSPGSARAEAIHLLPRMDRPARCAPRTARRVAGGARGGTEAALALPRGAVAHSPRRGGRPRHLPGGRG